MAGTAGLIVNKRRLAQILGTSERRLTELQREGLPIAVTRGARGRANGYNTREVLDWFIAREVARALPKGVRTREAEQNRLTQLQADALELTIGEKRRTLIPAAEIEPQWSAIVVAARQAILAVPARLAPILATMAGQSDPMRELLEEQLREALAKLAVDDAGADESGSGGDGPAGAG